MSTMFRMYAKNLIKSPTVMCLAKKKKKKNNRSCSLVLVAKNFYPKDAGAIKLFYISKSYLGAELP